MARIVPRFNRQRAARSIPRPALAALAEPWTALALAGLLLTLMAPTPSGAAAPAETADPAPTGAAATLLDRLPPPGRSGALRAEPLPLIEEGRLVGLVWLEGESPAAYGVRYAAWTGSRWEEPRQISPAGTGCQLGLSAARLADGSWLLAWSGHDGRHDRIVWSRGSHGRWSRPLRLTASPTATEITPALAASGTGAVAAWSQLAAGGYELRTAVFADGRWSAPAVAATGGALFPSFEAAPGTGQLRLLYRRAEPRGWGALDLDAGGGVLRHAAVAEAAPLPAPGATAPGSKAPPASPSALGGAFDRPVLLAAPGDTAVTFRWAASPASTAERTAAWAAGAPAAAAAPATSAGDVRGRVSPKANQPFYIAFGDSITSGYGDTTGQGYPGRLQTLLSTALNTQVTVVNDGLFGETTAEGLSRIGHDLVVGATGLLLMEGTNDINAKVPIGATVENLDAMASEAEGFGMKAYHATVIPRLSTADTDPTNQVTGTLAGAIRDLAWMTSRGLVDPFEVFFVLTPNYSQDYLGGTDKLHPNDAGYQLLAQTFADVLEGVDHIPPVTGVLTPANGLMNVSPSTPIEVELFDFGAGIDVANTQLIVDDQVISITPSGDSSHLVFQYQPPAPLAGVVAVALQTQDKADPPNTFSGTVTQFVITGTVFLPGDINHDGIVDGLDLLLFAPCFGAHRYNSNFQLYCDFNGDGIVDGNDLAILASNFGKRSF